MNASPSNDSGDFGFQIAPMVDVVFVLLLFFMAYANQSAIEHDLQANIPSPHPGAPSIPINITIDSAGGVYIGGQFKGSSASDADLAALTQELKTMEGNSKDPAIIRPAPDTAHDHVTKILSACKKAKISQVALR